MSPALRRHVLAILLAALYCTGAHAGLVGITDTQASAAPKQRYAGGIAVLLIGNATYVAPDTADNGGIDGWSALPGVVEDVMTVSAAFRALGADVTVVEDASTVELRRAVRSFLQAHGAIEDRLLVVYYAGQGHAAMLSRDRPTGFLVGIDSPKPPTGAEASELHRFFHREYYPLTDLFSPLAGVASRHVLVVLDSCFGGAVFESAASRIGDLSILGQGGHDGRVVQFLTSGEATERVPDQSGFRRSLVAGLGGAADADASGTITGRELARWINTQAGRCTDAQGQPVACRGPTVTPAFGLWRVSSDPPGDFTLSYGAQRPVSSYEVGTPFSDECAGCPELVRTPCHDAGPQQPLFVGTREVTLAEWDACVAGRGCSRVLDGPDSGRAIQPAAGVSFTEAQGFARWLSCSTGLGYRLPTATEHACLTRGPQANTSPDDPPSGRAAVCDGCGGKKHRGPAPVASLPPNGFGLYDALGNLWEWTESCSARNDESCTSGHRTIRGGSYATPSQRMTHDLQGEMRMTSRFPTLGFRLVRESQGVGFESPDCTSF